MSLWLFSHSCYQCTVLKYLKQHTLTLKEPTDSLTLSDSFQKQREKLEVLRNGILKIQRFMDVSPNYLLPISSVTSILTGANRMSWPNDDYWSRRNHGRACQIPSTSLIDHSSCPVWYDSQTEMYNKFRRKQSPDSINYRNHERFNHTRMLNVFLSLFFLSPSAGHDFNYS